MRVFRLLSARRLRQQPLRAAIAAVAVAAGVSLAVAIVVTAASVERSVGDFGRALAGPAPLRVVGATTRGGLAPDAVEAAATVEGVADVVPMVQAVTLADGPDAGGDATPVLALGVDCRVELLLGPIGCDPAAVATAGDLPLLVGPGIGADLATLRTDTGRVALGDVPVVDQLAALNDGRVVVFALAGAQRRFLQPSLVDVAYVVPDDGVELGPLRRSLTAAVGSHNGVLSAADPPPETQVVLVTFLPLFTILGLFGLGTGAVLVHNTVALSLEERRRQLAVLGALGAPRRTIIGGAVGEAALLGLAGGLLGVAGGVAVAGPIIGSLSGFTEAVAGVQLTEHVPGSAVALGVGLGAFVAGLAALLPARRATRLNVAAELSGRGSAEGRPIRLVRRAALWGSVDIAAGVLCWTSQLDGGLEPWQATVGPLAFLVLAVATPLTGSALAPLLIGRLARATRRSRRAGLLLALADLVRDPRRTGIMAVAITSPIIVGFATDGFVTSARASVVEDFTANSDGVSVSTIEVNAGSDAFLSPEAQEALAALPGVAELHRGIFVSVGDDIDDLIGVQAYEGTDLGGADLVLGMADPARLDAGEVLIGPGLARRTGARPGGTVELRTPSGVVEVPVQGVLESGDFGGFGVTMGYDRLVQLYGPQPPGFVVLEPAPGVSEEELADTVRQAAPSIDPELQVLTTTRLIDDIVASIDEQMLPFRAMQRALQVVAFVAVLSTLLLAGYQRRREHGLLAAVGARPPDLGRVVVTEAAVVSGAAVVCGALMGPPLLWAMLQVVPILVGRRNPFEPDWSALVGASAVAVVVAIAAALWPAWRAGRVEVLDALRYE